MLQQKMTTRCLTIFNIKPILGPLHINFVTAQLTTANWVHELETLA